MFTHYAGFAGRIVIFVIASCGIEVEVFDRVISKFEQRILAGMAESFVPISEGDLLGRETCEQSICVPLNRSFAPYAQSIPNGTVNPDIPI